MHGRYRGRTVRLRCDRRQPRQLLAVSAWYASPVMTQVCSGGARRFDAVQRLCNSERSPVSVRNCLGRAAGSRPEPRAAAARHDYRMKHGSLALSVTCFSRDPKEIRPRSPSSRG